MGNQMHEMNIGDMIHGFALRKRQAVEEASAEAYEFLHEKSGARLLFLQSDDDNKVFSITFRTPPSDDTGVAHIVEHSTLCGSRKYPLKEPFVELAKGSLNTFLNAMTFPDKTMYPVASRNSKDFQNLMDVYLDAVFYPAIYHTPEILMQEGWHYEIVKPEEPLRYSGVVYNEMKGALSSPDSLLGSRIFAALYPDTAYGYESGGDPAAIPALTQEMFLDFHRRFYHPSNSYIYLYGDVDIEEKLAYLDGEYLSHFDRIPVTSGIDRQQRFSSIKRVVEEYPVGAEESTEEKTFLALSAIVGEATDAETMIALAVLEHALLKTQAAPLRQALIDAKIGQEVDSIFEDALLQPFFSIIVQGAEPGRADAFRDVAVSSLRELAREGIDRTLLEASLNLLEFKLREADYGHHPKGLVYNIKAMNSWLYGGDPTMFLRYESLLKTMRDGLGSRYFEDVIQKCLLDNPHQVLLVLKPSRTMAKERENALAALLAEKKAAMPKEEIQRLIAMAEKLKERQQMPETPEALATIPVLQLSDIRKEETKLILEERSLSGAKILFSDVDTHGIAYLTVYFDIADVPQELLRYAFLASELIGMVSTASHTYAELANLVNLHTGGIDYDLFAYARSGEPDSCLPKFQVQARALVKKLPELFGLLAEILMTSSFADKKRIEELLLQLRANIEMDMMGGPHRAMATRLASYLTPVGQYNEQGAMTFYWFICDLSEHFDERYEELREKLNQLIPILFRREGLVVSVTMSEKDYPAFAEGFPAFAEQLSAQIFPAAEYHWDIRKQNEGLLSSSQVQYVGKAANFIKLGFAYTGRLRVLETLLRYDYFWANIRVQGGAYGAMVQFTRSGFFLFCSYRDPNLKRTLEIFDGTADYAKHFSASDREMDKFIIGTISGIDMPLTPKMKGALAAHCWLHGITDDDRQKLRDEVLSTRQEDIHGLAPLIAACMGQDVLCVFGNEAKLRENEELFGKLTQVVQ